MKLLLVSLSALVLLSACAQKQEDLKSPCVGAEGSPCDRRPVNDWWHKSQGDSHGQGDIG